MDDAGLVGRLEGVRDLPRDSDSFVEWDRPLGDAFGKRRALDELQDQCLHTLGFFETVNTRDVRMIQGCQESSFTLEPGQAFLVLRESRGKDFDGDLSLQLRVLRTVDLAHAAAS